ncbi:hypothetical protein DFH09DRAFT_1089047 [Mycena vulgaris]|nr:hypothetical protein DFH09DRAFT_1089047 [Mycena vulgaris]
MCIPRHKFSIDFKYASSYMRFTDEAVHLNLNCNAVPLPVWMSEYYCRLIASLTTASNKRAALRRVGLSPRWYEYAASSPRPIRRRKSASGGRRMVFLSSQFRTEVFPAEQQSHSDPSDRFYLAGWDARCSASVDVKFACTQPDYGAGRGARVLSGGPWGIGLLNDWMRVASARPAAFPDSFRTPELSPTIRGYTRSTLDTGTINGSIPGMGSPPRICIPCAEGMPPVDNQCVCYLSIHMARMRSNE